MNLVEKSAKHFRNGSVYLLHTEDHFPIETTDTFLPFYTKDAIGRKQNALTSSSLGSRSERWMVGVSVMSGCPVRCKFCATGKLKKWRNLTADEIVAQVDFVLSKNPEFAPSASQEFKINYTRMGEPFLNIEAVKESIHRITERYPNTHHYVSTIGIQGADYGWISGNVTLQVSLHALDQTKRDWLIPYKRKVSIPELGKVRTRSSLKTTVNLSLVDSADFSIDRLKENFSTEHFFVKLSPINPNTISDSNSIGAGVIKGTNIV